MTTGLYSQFVNPDEVPAVKGTVHNLRITRDEAGFPALRWKNLSLGWRDREVDMDDYCRIFARCVNQPDGRQNGPTLQTKLLTLSSVLHENGYRCTRQYEYVDGVQFVEYLYEPDRKES